MTKNRYKDVVGEDIVEELEGGEEEEEFQDEEIDTDISTHNNNHNIARTEKEYLLVVARVILVDNNNNNGRSTTKDDGAVVRIEILKQGNGPRVTREYRYRSMVTLHIETTTTTNITTQQKRNNNNNNNTQTNSTTTSRTPPAAGRVVWTTRKKDGAPEDEPFEFQPGVHLIEGWTEGVLQMKEGEHALLHVPASKGYGSQARGRSPNSTDYIPANSNLLFDIEILGKAKTKSSRKR